MVHCVYYLPTILARVYTSATPGGTSA